ncbi:MAG: flagellar basal body rod protein FlgB [Woeseiaceae bacterium]
MELNALSQHETALKFRALRNRVLTTNIANADTPNFKARDFEFAAALEEAQGNTLRMAGTNARHIGTDPHTLTVSTQQLKYRVPTQPSLDGNTVETDVEQAAFAENALQYRASLAFLDGSIRSIRYAIKGGD